MNIVISVIFVLAGLVILFGSIFNWDWMFRSSLARNLIQATGVDKAKIIYGAVGMLLLALAATLILVPQFNAPLQDKPDATMILKVGSDGCTVTRTDAVGSTSLEHFQWLITNKNFQTVFTRVADNEHEYRYNETGVYDMAVQAWYKGAYVTISNKVEINCTFK
jgi:Immunity protein 17